MRFLAHFLIVLLLSQITNPDTFHFETNQNDNYSVKLSKNKLDINTTYFSSKDLFNGKKFTVKGFKMKFSGRPLVVSNEIAFGNNLRFILKRQEVGSKVLIYDIETFMFENERVTKKPVSGKVMLEVTLTE